MNDERDDDLRHREPVGPPPLEVGAVPPRMLANRPFLWLVLAEGFAGLALWSYFLAVMGDAAYRFDATAGELGILLASFSITFIPSTPPFGTLADRWSPQRMMVVAIVAFAGSMVVASLATSVLWLSLSMAWVGLAEGVLWPARGALVPRLVEPDQLVRANGMIGLVRELPMALGPALAGAAVALWGRHAPYWVGLGGLAAAFVFYLLVPDRRVDARIHDSFLRDLVGGLRSGGRVPVLRLLFMMGAGAMLALGLMQTLEPLFVRRVLDRGQDALGFLWSMQGVGALLGATLLIRLRRAVGAEMRVVAVGVSLAGAGLLVYAATGSYAAAVPGAILFGAGYPLFFSTGQALIQRVSTAPGKVSAVFVVISEVGPLVAALGIVVLGQVDVRIWLMGAAVGLLVLGAAGVWASGRSALVVEEAGAA